MNFKYSYFCAAPFFFYASMYGFFRNKKFFYELTTYIIPAYKYYLLIDKYLNIFIILFFIDYNILSLSYYIQIRGEIISIAIMVVIVAVAVAVD